jgi:acylphosphatase
MARAAMQITVQGHVQGVGFRWWVVEQARRLGLEGWVRNRRDGSVEVLAIGEADDIVRLRGACGRGPAGASVRSVTVEAAEDDGSTGFEQKATL